MGDYGDYYWGFYKDYHRDPFPHFIVSTRESSSGFKAWGQGFPALGL